MAELVDAHGSGPCKITLVGVRFPLPAPFIFISIAFIFIRSTLNYFIYP